MKYTIKIDTILEIKNKEDLKKLKNIVEANTGNIKAGMWFSDASKGGSSIGFIDGEGLIFLGSTIAGFDPID